MSLRPHEILGLPENYNLYDAKSAFHSYSRQYHPDTPNCNFLSKEDKQNMFIVIEQAYKEILKEKEFGEMDAPMFSDVYYEDDVSIKKNNKITSLDLFNEEFERINSQENYDNPWSIHYNFVTEDKNSNTLDILRPEEYKEKYYYEYGINYCPDFTKPGRYTDINHIQESIDTTEVLETTLESVMKERENLEFSKEIEENELLKLKTLKRLEYDKRKIQLERDLRILKIE